MWLKCNPGQDLYYCIMAAIHFQGTPLVSGYVTLDDCVMGCCGCGAGRSL